MSPFSNVRQYSWLTLLLVLGACRNQAETSTIKPTGRPTIVTVNYPLAYFAEQLAGKDAVVKFPAPPDEDPDYWQPDEESIEQYQNADLILLNGSDYAKWTKSVSLPESK